MKKNRREAAYEQGTDAGANACLCELHPTYPVAIKIAYEGGIFNPFPWWKPLRRRAWQRGFDAVRKEFDEKRGQDANAPTRS